MDVYSGLLHRERGNFFTSFQKF